MTDTELEELIAGYLNKLSDAAIECGRESSHGSRYHLKTVREYALSSIIARIRKLEAVAEAAKVLADWVEYEAGCDEETPGVPEIRAGLAALDEVKP